ncbi:MAG: lantibiotic dehydratase [Candidatus Limnocylindria bacterium]
MPIALMRGAAPLTGVAEVGEDRTQWPRRHGRHRFSDFELRYASTPGKAARRHMNARRRDHPLLEPMDWGIVRAPLLPVERYLDGFPDATAGASLLPDELPVRAALAVGSNHLFSALERTDASARDAPRLRRKLLRYLIRMTTRPTPYGLFAGVGLIEWGPSTDIALAPRPLRTRTRPDMGWLMDLVAQLERDPAVRRQLGLFANPLALSRGGRVFLCEPADGPERRDPRQRVSIRDTAAVHRVLTRARTPAAHSELAAELHSFPGATPAKIDKLIDELWEQSFLLTDLRPPLTGINPGRYVCDRLTAVPAAQAVQAGLSALLDALHGWDQLPLEKRADSWRAVTKHAAELHQPAGSSAAPQVDMALPLGGTRIHRSVAREAARAAELLLRMTPYPDGPPYLAAYRDRFAERYGPAREVPLLELLDPEFGLGQPDWNDRLRSAQKPVRESERERILSDLAINALRERRLIVELDDALVSQLATWPRAPGTAPRSLEINVSVVAASPAAVDAGDFTVVVGPNVGADAAGRGLGRFADLLGTAAAAALGAVGAQEDPNAERLSAELIYPPAEARSANVAVRPTVVGYEILCGTAAGGPADRLIPLQELVVGLRDGRFYVRWPAAKAEIAISEKHMLNPVHAPPAVRFLQDVERDARAVLDGFTWASAAELAFLPRVQYGRVVVALAQWRIGATSGLDLAVADFQRALGDWRARWLVPRYVYLADIDQRLLLDLDDAEHGELLREELQRGPAAHGKVIQEALPGPADAWLTGPDGRHIAELVVPLMLRAPISQPKAAARTHAPATASARLRPPGSEWLYLKLYCPPALQDELIADELAPFANFTVSATLTDRWFFIRYVDTGPHLRVRFQGEPEVLLNRLLPQVCPWATRLVANGSCLSFAFDTYEREIERYGGVVGVSLAEELFAADRQAVASILRAGSERHALDRIIRAVLSVDALLEGLGMDAAERIAWYRTQVSPSRAEGQEYRRRREQLRQLLSPGPAAGGRAMWGRALDERRRALRMIGSRLDQLARYGQIDVPKVELYESYVHMHCNRLLGAGPKMENRVLRLALRTLESLSRVPVGDHRSAFQY